MRRLLHLPCSVVFLILLGVLAPPAQATFLSIPEHPVRLTGQDIVIYYDEATKTETVVTSPQFEEEPAIPPSQVGYWPFDERRGSSLVMDRSVYQNVPQFVEGAQWTPQGKISSALTFDGSTGRLIISQSASLDLGAVRQSFTVDFWLKPEDNEQFTEMFLGKMSGRSNKRPFGFFISANGTMAFQVVDSKTRYGDLGSTAFSTSQIPERTWTHIVGVRDAATKTLKLYVNGVLEGTTADLEGDARVPDSIIIGARRNSVGSIDFHWKGTIDNVALYNYARTVGQVKESYNDGKGKDLSEPPPTVPESPFGWIFPIREKPTVNVVRRDLFAALSDLIAPPTTIPTEGPIPMRGIYGSTGVGDRTADRSAIAERKSQIDIYDLSIISAGEQESLMKWLTEQSFSVSSDVERVLDEYLKNGYSFVIAKVNPDVLGPFVEGQIREGTINPVMLSFRSDRIIYPLRLTGASLTSDTDVDSFAPPEIPFSVSVFAKKKQAIPGFATVFAGSVKGKDIANLSLLTDGKPWIPRAKNRYLTVLSGSLSPSEMNNDFVFAEARDNEPIGGGVADTSPKTRILVIMAALLVFEGLIVTRIIRHAI